MTGFLSWCAMGGYALYVWPSYGLFALILLANVWGVRRQRQRTQKLLRQWYKRQDT